MKVILEFKGSHHYEKLVEKTDFYCPNCGKQTVWLMADGGDYYQGESSHCTTCNYCLHLDHCYEESEPAYISLIQQIREGKAITPTTKVGR